MRLIFDVDGVLRNWCGSLVRCYNRDFNTDVKVEDIDNFNLKLIPQFDSSIIIPYAFNEMSEDILLNAEPFKDAAKVVNTLYKEHEIIVSTAQPSKRNSLYTLRWLIKYGFKFHHLHFTLESQKDIFKDADYIVEDKPKTLEYFYIESSFEDSYLDAPMPICIDRPYNKNINENIPRINDLNDLIAFL